MFNKLQNRVRGLLIAGQTLAESKVSDGDETLEFDNNIQGIEIVITEDEFKEFTVAGQTVHVGNGGMRTFVQGGSDSDDWNKVEVPELDGQAIVNRLV